jgi:AmmeMemoRadiSam system protein B/AmmeMemoRadiSam system protein A
MAVSGAFYPADVIELNQELDGFLTTKTSKEGQILALVAPHAGYSYSGKVAGQAFAKLLGKKYKTVWVLGPSHHVSFSGVVVPNYTHFKTPLGEIEVSAITNQLLKEKNFQIRDEVHQSEHALEVELPFLQKTLGNFELVPLIFGNQTTLSQLKEIVASLENYYDEQTLIVVSCDFTHYGPNYGYAPFGQNFAEKVKAIDMQVVDYLINFQTEELFDYLENTAITNDGTQILTFLSEFLKESKAKGELVAYDTSGNITGDTENSVSYASLVFTGSGQLSASKNQLAKEDQDYLLGLARQTLNHYYETGEILSINEAEIPERLKTEQGVFVTLTKNGALRGCIGYIEPVKSIYQSVIDNAISAAVNDSRFLPVTQNELKDIEIEISVLSVPKILSEPAENRLTALRPEVDGVVLEEEKRRATYLPQVWEDLSDPEEFLESLCNKGGWSGNCWQKDSVKLYTYQADVFHE